MMYFWIQHATVIAVSELSYLADLIPSVCKDTSVNIMSDVSVLHLVEQGGIIHITSAVPAADKVYSYALYLRRKSEVAIELRVRRTAVHQVVSTPGVCHVSIPVEENLFA